MVQDQDCDRCADEHESDCSTYDGKWIFASIFTFNRNSLRLKVAISSPKPNPRVKSRIENVCYKIRSHYTYCESEGCTHYCW